MLIWLTVQQIKIRNKVGIRLAFRKIQDFRSVQILHAYIYIHLDNKTIKKSPETVPFRARAGVFLSTRRIPVRPTSIHRNKILMQKSTETVPLRARDYYMYLRQVTMKRCTARL